VWLTHTTGAVEAIDAMFIHNDPNALNVTLSHLYAMQRDYGWTVYPEAWNRNGGLWGDQWYLWGVPLGIQITLERLMGIDINRVEKDPAAQADGILTVRDHAPDDWETAHARVPESSGAWIDVQLAVSADGKTKTIKVADNTAGTLLMQPWLGGRKLVSATPGNYTVEKGHVCWKFVDAAAKSVTVTVVVE